MSNKRTQIAQRVKKTLLQIVLSPWRFFKAVCFTVGLAVIGLGLSLGVYTYLFYRSTPDLGRYRFTDLQTVAVKRVSDRRPEARTSARWVPINQVSRDFLYSIVMSEDSTFFEHDGINFDAIASSLAENIKERKAAFGGSTISQQVVKNLFLDSQKHVSRKLKEILITRSLEQHFSKNQILELYLNIAEFGPDIYGVGAAAEHYFRKTPSEINAAEGAFIALMLPSPKRYYYAVIENRNLTLARRKRINRVLRDMWMQEYISESQYRKYVKFDFFSKINRLPAGRTRKDKP